MKQLQELIFLKQDLLKKKTLLNRIKIKHIDNKMKKIIHKIAIQQSKIIYNKTYELYDEIIKANFK